MKIIDPAQENQKALQNAILDALPGATVSVEIGGPGHYSLTITSEMFRSHSMLEQQRLVYSAIAPLMTGANAPVHAIDRLVTKVPE